MGCLKRNVRIENIQTDPPEVCCEVVLRKHHGVTQEELGPYAYRRRYSRYDLSFQPDGRVSFKVDRDCISIIGLS